MSSVLEATQEHVASVAVRHEGLPGLRAWRVGNRVGEAPTWDASTGTLLWIDVRDPAVLRLDPATDTVTRWMLPEVVGALGLAQDGSVVVALRRSLARLDLASGCLTPAQDVPVEPAHNRLNDGKVSPSGRWFVFGSMDDRTAGKEATGALYCARVGGRARRLADGLTVANGIAFGPDARTLYFSDSHAGRVFRASWDESSGTIGGVETFCVSDEDAGRPDGAAVDAKGDYWSAGVSAGCLNRFSPEGALVGRTPVPCRAPTMPCFGGAAYDLLFVTTLVRPGWSVGPEDLDGALLSWPARASGLPPARWT
jgi:sugar lactone lactonase YvrE